LVFLLVRITTYWLTNKYHSSYLSARLEKPLLTIVQRGCGRYTTVTSQRRGRGFSVGGDGRSCAVSRGYGRAAHSMRRLDCGSSRATLSVPVRLGYSMLQAHATQQAIAASESGGLNGKTSVSPRRGPKPQVIGLSRSQLPANDSANLSLTVEFCDSYR